MPSGRTNTPRLRDHLANVNEAASGARNGWVAFIGIMAFFAVSLAGITHKDLLFNNLTQLPVINAPIPVAGFFTFGPPVLVFLHFGVLLQHAHLYRKLLAFKVELDSEPEIRLQKGDIRDELHSYSMVQSVLNSRLTPSLKIADRFMIVVVLAIAPLFLLLYFQLKFLPYQDEKVTWAHRVFLILDVGMIWSVGGFLLAMGKGWCADWKPKQQTYRLTWPLFDLSTLIILTTVVTSFASLLVLRVPDEWIDSIIERSGADLWPFLESQGAARSLSLVGINLATEKSIEKGEAALLFRDRHFRYADFSSSNLANADFESADLRQADLQFTILMGAKLAHAHLQGTMFNFAQLQGANLLFAQLQGADLEFAELQGADLTFAEMEGVNLQAAQLGGVSLIFNSTEDENFRYIRLQGADLSGASIWLNDELKIKQVEWTDFSDLYLGVSDLELTIASLKKISTKTQFHDNIVETIQRLENLQKDFEEKTWPKTDKEAFCFWHSLQNSPPPNSTQRGQILAGLACADNSGKAYVANGISRNLSHGNFELAAAFLQKMDEACPATRAKINANIFANLQRRAQQLPDNPSKTVPITVSLETAISSEEADKICAASDVSPQ